MTINTIKFNAWSDGVLMLIDDVDTLFFLDKKSHRPIHCITGNMCSILFNALSCNTPTIATPDKNPKVFKFLFDNFEYFYDLMIAYSDDQISASAAFESLGWNKKPASMDDHTVGS